MAVNPSGQRDEVATGQHQDSHVRGKFLQRQAGVPYQEQERGNHRFSS
jgi:hypothetical protein